MSDTTREDGVLTTGRPLDDRGEPTAGPALELDADGPGADRLRESPHALAASPGADTWATLLERPDEGTTDRPVLAQWLGPDAPAPPPHVHPTTETFAPVEGVLTVEVSGETRRLEPGESVTVEAGVEHGFRNETDETVAFEAELPSVRTAAALYTVWGLDAEDGADASGRPGPLTALLVAADAYPDTVTTVAPVAAQRALWATVGRAARALGRSGVDDRYLDDAFWERRIEQPN